MPKRVMVFTDTYVVGGAERVVSDVITHADPSRFEVVLAGNNDPALGPWLARSTGRTIRRHEIVIRWYHGLPAITTRREQRAAAGDAAAAPDEHARSLLETVVTYAAMPGNFVRLRRLFLRHRPDVLHINNGGYPGGRGAQIAALAAKSAGVPRVVHFVFNMPFDPLWPAPIERAIDRAVDRAVDLWVTCADATTRALGTQRDIAPAGIQTIHLGVPAPPPTDPASDLGFASGAFNVAIVAGLQPRKGHLVALQAFRQLVDAGVNLRVALVGDGPERQRIVDRIHELGLTDRIAMFGWRDDADAIYAASDVLLLPSLSHEGFPYTTLETMMHGTPVVATDVAGLSEQIEHGRTGFVVPPGDAAAIAGALQQLADDPAQRRAIGAAGRERTQRRFSVEVFIEHVQDAWDGGRPVPPTSAATPLHAPRLRLEQASDRFGNTVDGIER